MRHTSQKRRRCKTRMGLDATNAINLSEQEEFDPVSLDCTHKSLLKGPTLHANLFAPSFKRNSNVSAQPLTRPTCIVMRSSMVVQEGVPINESNVSDAAFKIARLGATLNPLYIVQHMGTNLKCKEPIGVGRLGPASRTSMRSRTS
jgi:hypothetical protein